MNFYDYRSRFDFKSKLKAETQVSQFLFSRLREIERQIKTLINFLVNETKSETKSCLPHANLVAKQFCYHKCQTALTSGIIKS